MKFVIEIISPVSQWALIEYGHISQIVGKKNLMFTNTPSEKLEKFGQVNKKSVTESIQREKTYCLLDPKAEKGLSVSDGFDFYVFGGILGDYPPQNRTRVLSEKMKCEKRNLGDVQMPTDTAVLVTKMIVKDKVKFEKIKFADSPKIMLKKGLVDEEIELPYRYVVKGGKPVISEKLVKYLKQKDSL